MSLMENTIAKEIKRIRKELGLYQHELAEKINKTRFDISNYEMGRAMPPADVFVRIQELEKADNCRN